MVYLTRKTRFSAAHRYYLDDLPEEENRRLFGPCALPYGHGHDYVAEVTVSGRIDPRSGMVVNVADLKPVLADAVTDPFDGQYLTPRHPLLRGRIPATEVLARLAWERIEAGLARAGLPVRLERVWLAESAWLGSECLRGEGDGPMVSLTRSYEFAAAHRLHADALSEVENQALFGKCNHPHGHGHNYILEVTVTGEPDPRTGLLIDLGLLDRVVHAEIVDRYDHRHLNFEIEELRGMNPTSENLVRVVWARLAPALPVGALRRVTVRETERNIFTYTGEDE